MLIRSFIGLTVIVALWSGGVYIFDVPEYLLPEPITVLERIAFLYENADLIGHLRATVTEILWGGMAGFFAGVLMALVFARFQRAERLASPIILLVQAAPKIAIAPLLLLWFGLGAAPKIVLVAIVTFFPVMTGMLTGLRYVNKSYLDLAAILKLSPLQSFIHILLPSALPSLLAGTTVASTLAVTAAVIGELMGSNKGLGYLLASGQENADSATVIGTVMFLSFLGWGFFESLEFVRRRVVAKYSDG